MTPIDTSLLIFGPKSAMAAIRSPFKEVFDGTYKGECVLIHALPLNQSTGKAVPTLLRISALMRKARHPNVLEFVGMGSDKTRSLMLTEATDHGTLSNHLEQNSPRNVRGSIKILRDVANGMRWVHDNGILHRALTAASIHVTRAGEAKVGNFEFARQDALFGVRTNFGIPSYAAPEILSRTPIYTEKIDVYSFAMLIVEVVTTQQPFANIKAPQATLMKYIVQRNYRPVFVRTSEWPAALFELMEKCWDANPVLRPSFNEIVECLEAILAADALHQ
ncbi:TKL protein kinase [Saprolegnia diclina VS20]|uniref:TKL protein kinase n=1 Tax=Saprolegnia diclina (strain VS20) TaxID=1156394 RepID=T0Q773_SAPDV|nr:TKL protein kinase [Saprolegnia diclina VS20]EQC33724.1 TKL protein kinase [Saprolegnia diclina VS20]|eukprot:XP_008612947.1 TKL protein kinase [Saprolegnia diclina VS20]